MIVGRSFFTVAILVSVTPGCTQRTASAAQEQKQPNAAASGVDLAALGRRAKPGPGHAALEPLVGCWQVEKSVFVAMGSPDSPAKSEGMTTERRWVGDGRFLESKTTGTMGGQPYSRTGFLGYNPMDRRFEWATVDNQTPIMMTYQARPGSGADSANQIDMVGTFTDLGVTGERNVGKPVRQRTRIQISNNDRHTFEIYFQAPDQPEILADRMVFARVDCPTSTSGGS